MTVNVCIGCSAAFGDDDDDNTKCEQLNMRT